MSVSVVIPCSNDDRWITQALDSVLLQSRAADEVIVVLDGSRDASESLARQHPLAPRVVRTRLHNAAAARNHGVSLARGEWIAFLDADDWWTDAHLATATELLAAGRDVAYFGHFREFWQAADREYPQPPLVDGAARGGLASDQFYAWFLGPNPGWPTSGMVVSRARFNEVGGFDVTQVRRHDTELFARVVHGRTWAYNPAPVFFYRKDVPGSISTNRPACSYFRFLADEKIARLYDPARAAARLRERAAICLSDTLQSAADEDLFRRASAVCLRHLDWRRRLFYRVALRAPGLGRRLHGAVTARKRPRAAGAPPARGVPENACCR